MTIKATLWAAGTGEEREMEIISTDKASGTAIVSPTDWDSKGMYFNNRPEWFVEMSDLNEIRLTCERCGAEHDPAGACSCGWDWRKAEPMSDEDDAIATQEMHRMDYGGR